MSDFKTIIYQKKDGIAYITLNRPEKMNAVNLKMRDELYEILSAVEDDPDVLVGIVKGAGDQTFSAGADLTEFGTAPSQIIARQARWERDLWGRFLATSKPLIAAIQGFALGAGIEMSLCCDLRICTEDSRFGLPEVSLGLIPTASGTQTLSRTVPRGRAMEIVLRGDFIGAEEAFRIGLVNKVVKRESLLPEAEKLAEKIISQNQLEVRYAKKAVVRGLDLPLENGLKMESYLFAMTLRG